MQRYAKGTINIIESLEHDDLERGTLRTEQGMAVSMAPGKLVQGHILPILTVELSSFEYIL